MQKNWLPGRCLAFFILLWTGSIIGWEAPLLAQVVEDATLPNNSVVNLAGTTYQIDGGTTTGSNLYHSFQQFSVPMGFTAYFNNALAIQNIIARVVGPASTIDGIIQANGTANLFLLNPSGIVFGPNAQLNVGGSFIASTAQSLRFADGAEFSAVSPASSLLTVSVPLGLQMGPNPTPITVQGTPNNVTFDPFTLEIDRSFRPVGLQVQPGQTLALVGGDVNLVSGNLTAEQGRIEVGSVRGGGLVTLSSTNPGWQLGYSGVSSFGDVQLSQAASADVSGDGAGEIRIQAGRVNLVDGSVLLALTLGSRPGVGITINATESVNVSSAGITANDVFAGTSYISAIATDANSVASARGGNLTITTPLLRVTDGSQLTAATYGPGNAGNLTVQAQTVELIGGIPDLTSSGLFTNVNFGSGNAGNLSVTTDNLFVKNGASISTSTFDLGNAGNVTVRARNIEMDGEIDLASLGVIASGIFASASNLLTPDTGNGGTITIESDRLQITNGAQVSATTFAKGNAGSIDVKAQMVELKGASTRTGNPSGLFSSTATPTAGNGGSIRIESNRVQITDGAQISATTTSTSNAGSIEVNAQTIELSGSTTRRSPGGIFSSTEAAATGNAGNITLKGDRLQLTNGAQVSATTSSQGNAGLINVQVNNIALMGTSLVTGTPSGLFSSVEPLARGNGGSINVIGNRLQIQDGAQIAASTFSSGNAGTLQVRVQDIDLAGVSSNQNFPSGLFAQVGSTATGSGGMIAVDAGSMRLREGAQIQTSTFGSGNAGSLSVSAQTIELMGGRSQNATGFAATVETGARGNGGTLTVSTKTLRVFEGAQLQTRTAGSGDAGNLTVNATDIELAGSNPQGKSGLFASAITGTGAGGDLKVSTERLLVRDGATISVSNFSSNNTAPPGQGPAGNLEITARRIDLNDGATLTADSAGGTKGNIRVDSQLLLLRRGSRISTNAVGTATGGNIDINTDFLIAVKGENSDITANSVSNFGGRVTVTAKGIFGIAARPRLTPFSDITASSELGPLFNGVIELRTPGIDPTQGLMALPTGLIDPDAQISAACERSQGNEFILTGRGGLPEDATQPLTGGIVWQDLRPTNGQAGVMEQAEILVPVNNSPQTPSQSRIVEAQGWVIDQGGIVTLIAKPSSNMSQTSWYSVANCLKK